MDGEKQSFWRKLQRPILAALIFLTLLVGFVLLYEPSTPDGIYYWPGLACGHGVWIFKDGTIYDQCIGESNPQKITTYIKSGNQWISKVADTTRIKPSVFGITLYGSSFKNGHEFYFRDQYSWIIDCQDWLQSHF
jgi:hypothetical protein